MPDETCSANTEGLAEFPAPELPYRPQDPKDHHPGIALIACGGITAHHLNAYRSAGYNVVTLCDVNREAAEARRDEFYPEADVCMDYHEVLRRDDVEVVDLAAHAPVRAPMIEAALNAGKHVLSQKPFVLDLDFGERMADLADRKGLRIGVNQNGRWAPHFSYIRQAIAAGLLGPVTAAHLSVHWNHNWIKDREFDTIHHVLLYDFAIHWFDILCCFMGDRTPSRVFASATRSPSQEATPPLLAEAVVEYDGAQASLIFDADTRFGAQDRTYVAGPKGTLLSVGPDLNRQAVTLYTDQGYARPPLEGIWFPDGFHGTMGELLRAIEENREPANSARNNLKSLALAFAAMASADAHEPRRPGEVRAIPAA